SNQVRRHERLRFDADRRVLLPDHVNHARTGADLDQRLPADHQVAALVACDLSRRLDAGVEVREYRAGALKKVTSDRGELHPPARALEQGDLQLSLELHDSLAQGGL